MTTIGARRSQFQRPSVGHADQLGVLSVGCGLVTIAMVASYALASNRLTVTLLALAVLVPGPAVLAVLFGLATLRRAQTTGAPGGAAGLLGIVLGVAGWAWGAYLAAGLLFWSNFVNGL